MRDNCGPGSAHSSRAASDVAEANVGAMWPESRLRGAEEAAPHGGQSSLLRAGETCWRVESAGRIAFLLDNAAYFAAAKAAMLRAERSILLLGWDFDPRTRLCPDAAAQEPPDEIGPLLTALATQRPGLDIRVLVWDIPLLLTARRQFFPRRAAARFRGGQVHFHLDHAPIGACHHQKSLIIDDAIAFCGGGDFAINRWDTPRHPDHDARRRLPFGREHAPRHEVMMLVDGGAAAALGQLARERWLHATGERIAPPPPVGGDPWPQEVPPDLMGAPRLGIARTEPAWMHDPPAREVEALYLAAIAAARRFIYLENQYFAWPRLADALAARLAEAEGPEILLIVSRRSPGILDRMTMDAPRDSLVARLRAADRHGRFSAYAPRTAGGRTVIVHSKVAIIDDRLLRVGSANLNNRSGGFDTECDLALEAPAGPDGARVQAAIRRFRERLIGHFLDVDDARMAAAITAAGGLAKGIEALDGGRSQRRLPPLQPGEPGPFGAVVAALQLGNPCGPEDSWRPWRRWRAS
ncbi:phospholipase D-like domain-containing protein [Siccirubricoccus phaeus]|uniref:phospholipase D-like domain-containing protein n=1 Tax=Siccirubricoccus phaeus TaxID=2595053 RepID=UPI001A9C6DA7|nr:phospholipase D-like domain-containing protein [Siccirubricoccus phaeus]